MLRDIFTQSAKVQSPNELTRVEKANLTEYELVCLRLFATRLGDRIVEDTSLFTSTERKRLAFFRWLDMHGKLSY